MRGRALIGVALIGAALIAGIACAPGVALAQLPQFLPAPSPVPDLETDPAADPNAEPGVPGDPAAVGADQVEPLPVPGSRAAVVDDGFETAPLPPPGAILPPNGPVTEPAPIDDLARSLDRFRRERTDSPGPIDSGAFEPNRRPRFVRAPDGTEGGGARRGSGAGGLPIDQPDTMLVGTAQLRQLDKMTGRTVDVVVSSDETAEIGRLRIALDGCRTPADGGTRGTMAHLRIWDTKTPDDPVFGGWMFADSPALSAMDHARYDVWVLACGTPARTGDDGRRRGAVVASADPDVVGGTDDAPDAAARQAVDGDPVESDSPLAPTGLVPIPLPRPLF